MRFYLYASIVFTVALQLACADQSRSSLKEFISEEGGFSVLLSESPKQSVSRPIKDPNMGNETQNHLFTVDYGDRGALIVSYMEHQVLQNFQKADKAQFDAALDKMQEGVRSALKGVTVKAKSITLDDKYPGREFVLDIPDEGKYRCRVYMVDDRCYQLVAVGKAGFSESKKADDFLNSFKLQK